MNAPASTEFGMPDCAVAIDALADREVARHADLARQRHAVLDRPCCRRCRPARRAARRDRSSRRARSARGCRSCCPAPMRVSPTAGRSIVVFAPISTSSSMTTSPICGILWCVPSARCAKPKPSLPITAPSWMTTRLPICTRSRIETRAWITQSSPIARAGADRHVRIHDRAGADRRAVADADEGARSTRRRRSTADGATSARRWTPAAGDVSRREELDRAARRRDTDSALRRTRARRTRRRHRRR